VTAVDMMEFRDIGQLRSARRVSALGKICRFCPLTPAGLGFNPLNDIDFIFVGDSLA
jgi:hypothetical protein